MLSPVCIILTWSQHFLGRDTLGDSELGDIDDIPIDPNVPGDNDIVIYDENSINSSTDTSGKIVKQDLLRPMSWLVLLRNRWNFKTGGLGRVVVVVSVYYSLKLNLTFVNDKTQ